MAGLRLTSNNRRRLMFNRRRWTIVSPCSQTRECPPPPTACCVSSTESPRKLRPLRACALTCTRPQREITPEVHSLDRRHSPLGREKLYKSTNHWSSCWGLWHWGRGEGWGVGCGVGWGGWGGCPIFHK